MKTRPRGFEPLTLAAQLRRYRRRKKHLRKDRRLPLDFTICYRVISCLLVLWYVALLIIIISSKEISTEVYLNPHDYTAFYVNRILETLQSQDEFQTQTFIQNTTIYRHRILSPEETLFVPNDWCAKEDKNTLYFVFKNRIIQFNRLPKKSADHLIAQCFPEKRTPGEIASSTRRGLRSVHNAFKNLGIFHALHPQSLFDSQMFQAPLYPNINYSFILLEEDFQKAKDVLKKLSLAPNSEMRILSVNKHFAMGLACGRNQTPVWWRTFITSNVYKYEFRKPPCKALAKFYARSSVTTQSYPIIRPLDGTLFVSIGRLSPKSSRWNAHGEGFCVPHTDSWLSDTFIITELRRFNFKGDQITCKQLGFPCKWVARFTPQNYAFEKDGKIYELGLRWREDRSCFVQSIFQQDRTV